MSIQLTLKFNFQARREPGDVTVELRGGTQPYDLVASVNGRGGGNAAAEFCFENVTDGVPYYIVVKSANSLETWSATAVTFSAGQANYDFTLSLSQAFGNNQTLSADGIPSIYQGDVNQDGAINLADVIHVYNDATSFKTGALSTDINGDHITDMNDMVTAYTNSSDFVEVKRPH